MISRKTKQIGGNPLRKWLNQRGSHIESELGVEQKRELKMCFSLFDEGGTVSPDDAMKAITVFLSLKPNEDQLAKWVSSLKKNAKRLNFKEFIGAAVNFGYGENQWTDDLYSKSDDGGGSQKIHIDLIALAAHRRAQLRQVMAEHDDKHEKEHIRDFAEAAASQLKTEKKSIKRSKFRSAATKIQLFVTASEKIKGSIESCRCGDWNNSEHFHCRMCCFSSSYKNSTIQHEQSEFCQCNQRRGCIQIPKSLQLDALLPRKKLDQAAPKKPVDTAPKVEIGSLRTTDLNQDSEVRFENAVSAWLRAKWSKGHKKSLKDVVKAIVLALRFRKSSDRFHASDVERVSYSYDHIVAVTSYGSVFTWGHVDFKWLGRYDPKISTKLEKDAIEEVHAEYRHKQVEIEEAAEQSEEMTDAMVNASLQRLVLEHDERVAAVKADYCRRMNVPGFVPSLSLIKIVDVAVGDEHTVLLTNEGQVYSWGSGAFGKLGHGHIDNVAGARLITALDKRRIRKIAAGAQFTMVLTNNGVVLSFGDNRFGQLGVGDFKDRSLPELVEFRDVIGHISCGGEFSAALTKNGFLYTWGQGWNGVLAHKRTKELIPETMITLAPALTSLATFKSEASTSTPSKALKQSRLTGHHSSGFLHPASPAKKKMIRPKTADPFSSSPSSSSFISSTPVASSPSALHATPTLLKRTGLSDGRAKCCPKPGLVEYLRRFELTDLCCGRDHIVVVQNDAERGFYHVFSWGDGAYGKLGHNDILGTLFEPLEIAVLANIPVSSVYCGMDFTAVWIGEETVVFGKPDFQDFYIKNRLNTKDF